MENQNSSNNIGQTTARNVNNSPLKSVAKRRVFIPISYGLCIMLFFLTFCTFKCAKQDTGSATAPGIDKFESPEIGSASGINLVIGTELKTPQIASDQESKGEKIPPNVGAILALVAAIGGLIIFLINKVKKEALIGMIVSGAGILSLILLQITIKIGIKDKYHGGIIAEFQFAYWLDLLLFLFAGFMSFLRMRLIKENNTHATNELSHAKFCTDCGTAVPPDAMFCPGCNKKI
jgi:hypothetical protein